MKSVLFAQSGKRVEVKTEANVLTALLSENVPVKMACGGRGLCATCHVYVEQGADCLTPRTKREDRTLGLISGAGPSSRLSCQAKVLKDGVIVKLPKGLYVEKTVDLEELIGRRADDPVLHPLDGRILVPAGKIITRTTVNQLQSVEVDVQRMLQQSKDVA